MSRNDAGKLRSRVTLHQPVVSANATGGQVTTWDVGVPVWAKVSALQGTEAFTLGALQGTTMWSVTIRYRSGVSPKSRITLGDGRVLLVTAVVPLDERRVMLRLMCTQERVAATV